MFRKVEGLVLENSERITFKTFQLERGTAFKQCHEMDAVFNCENLTEGQEENINGDARRVEKKTFSSIVSIVAK